MLTFEHDGTQMCADSYSKPDHRYERRAIRLTSSGKFSCYVLFNGQRHRLGTFNTFTEAETAANRWRPTAKRAKRADPVEPIEITQAGYWLAPEEDGDSRWSVWHFDGKGGRTAHAGPCSYVPTEGFRMDPKVDKEPKMFGCDWDYYVTDGKEHLGNPNTLRTERTARRRAQGTRYDMEAVKAAVADGSSVPTLMERFEVSRRTAYNWINRFS